jgi:cytochrome c-type biogenesis protein
MINETLSLGGLFLEGLLSFFSPCVLPLIPLYMGYLSADVDPNATPRQRRLATASGTFFFVLGICTVFFLAALGASAFRTFFNAHTLELQLIGGVLLIVFGLISLDVIRLPFLSGEHRFQVTAKSRWKWLNAWLMGFFFSFAWSPCIGPLLASALVVAANASSSLIGFLDIAAYALGFIIMFLLVGLFTEEILSFLKDKKNVVRITQKVGGALIIAMGAYMLYNSFKSVRQLQSSSTSAAASEPAAAATAETGDAAAASAAADDGRTDAEKYGFTLKNGKGEDVSLTDFTGKTVVVNFFATWCTYCNEEMPDLQDLQDTRDDVKVLMIAAPNNGNEGNIDYIEKYMSQKGYSLEILYDSDYSVSQAYGISGYPTSYIVKPDGNFLGYVPGYLSNDKLLEYVDRAAGKTS